MGMNESDKNGRNEGSVLTKDLATRLNEYAVMLTDKTRLRDIIDYDPKLSEKPDHATQKWFEALSTLKVDERGQVVRTLTALERAGVNTVGDIRNIPILSRKHMRWATDLGVVRFNFIKQLFPVPHANPTR